MATLVLTAVGTAVGGPIGGAIGALIGRSVDERVFRPATRNGPRLTELAVQTSSYGTQIPKLFGTIRVAGTVIWSTDLIETRSKSGGSKGQPSTATYSYSASFAVLLSARAILGIGRIWAEGKLLRGAGGDWKATTGFRLYLGSEDQSVDPLIASADPTTPAYRGCAYAVFEALQLADFGNRIPSLTFEVIADAGPITVGTVAMALADEVDAEVAQELGGYAAAGDSVAGVLDSLAWLGGAWWSPTGMRIAMRDDAEDSITLANDSVSDGGKSGRRMRAIAAIETVPRTLSVAHHDPVRDYQIGVQQAVRPGAGTRAERIEVPAVVSAETARGIAARALDSAEALRTRRTVSLGIDRIGMVPGSAVRIAGESGVWRVRTVSLEGLATQIALSPVTIGSISRTAPSGRVLAAPDHPVGATLLVAVEHPELDDVALMTPRLSVMATGVEPGWRGAALLYSLDGGASWVEAGVTAAPATLGLVEEPPVDAPTLADGRDTMVVSLAREDMVLTDADAGGLAQGRNLALIGEELIQYGRAEPVAGSRWRLSNLHRGARGTEWAVASHQVGERFAVLDRDAIRAIDVPIGAIGQDIQLLATGIGDVAGPVGATVRVTGESIFPPAPVDLAVTTDGSEGNWRLHWMRGSRSGWIRADDIEFPPFEERRRYSVVLTEPEDKKAT